MNASLFFDRPNAPAPRWVQIVTFLVISALLAAICCWLFAGSLPNARAVWGYRLLFLKGWTMTIGISIAALALSSTFAILLAFARRSTFLPIRALAILYIELVRGSPLLVQILFFWYVVASRLDFQDRTTAGILILSGFSAAYIAEMIRSGIGSIASSQLESARAIGLTTFQTYRFVIFPQAIRQLLPPLTGQFASLIKDSSLLSIVGISEFTLMAEQANSATFSTFECYLPLGLGYLLLTLPISAFASFLQRSYHYET